MTPDVGATMRTSRPDPLAEARNRRALEQAWSGKGGLWGQTIRLAPPMCITREDADFILAVLDEAIGAI